MENTTHALAESLEVLARALRQHPSVNLGPYSRPSLYLRCDEKAEFLALVKAMPHPLKKEVGNTDVDVAWTGPPLRVTASIERNTVCHLVTPAQEAVYDCEPLLSEAEIKELP